MIIAATLIPIPKIETREMLRTIAPERLEKR